MPKSSDSVKIELKDILDAKGFDVIMRDGAGDDLPVPEDAEAFIFQFRSGDENYGTVTVTIDDASNLTVWYNTEVTHNSSGSVGENSAWVKFIKQLRRFAHRRSLSFKMRDLDKFEKEMKKRHHRSKIAEGYYGTRNTSYSDSGPATIKMIIKHNKSLDENDARFRYVDKIFLENHLGERVLVPSTKPGVGRVFARHLAEGGQHNDQRWAHLCEMIEDIKKLGGFVRATRGGQFNESVGRVVSEAQEQYINLRESFKRLQSSRGYNAYFESWSPVLTEDDDTTTLTELFKSNQIDSRIESALPVLKKFNITVAESAELSVFEDWATGVLDEMLKPTQPSQKDELIAMLGPDSKFMPLGPDASSAIGELSGILEDDELNDRLRRAAQRDTDRDARAIIVGWMSEQEGNEYNEVLNVIEPDSTADQHDTAHRDEPKKPHKKKQTQPAPDLGLPPLPDLPPPPPAPVKEEHEIDWVDPNIARLKQSAQINEDLNVIKRLIGL